VLSEDKGEEMILIPGSSTKRRSGIPGYSWENMLNQK
jgi:hypothetical protein